MFTHQAELLLASDSAKASQRVDLENHIKTVTSSLEKANSQLAGVKTQLDQVNITSRSNKKKNNLDLLVRRLLLPNCRHRLSSKTVYLSLFF